jgi:hypothetical protein
MARMGRFVRFAMALSLGFGAVSSPASAQSDVNA